MVITETTRRIVDYAYRVRENLLEGFPVAWMLSFPEAMEFWRDLYTNPYESLQFTTYIDGVFTTSREPLVPSGPELSMPPHPRSGHVLWGTYKDVTPAIKGDLDA